MSKIITALKLFKDINAFKSALILNFCFFLSDRLYLKLLFKYNLGYSLNLNNPRTFNEKLQWLKLYNRKPEYKKMVDKYAVKEYVSNLIGEEYIIPTYYVWDNIKEIDWHFLPSKFVIKTTNGGGSSGVIICKNKERLNISSTVMELKRALKSSIYKKYKEWPYKGMKKRIIAEQLLEEENRESPNDYKVMCFDGKVKLIEYHEGRFSSHHTQDFYDREWNLTDITQGRYGEYNTIASPKPKLLDEMIRLSEILAAGIPHIRVDWYITNDHLYFGELTFFDGSGLCPFDRYEDDILLGSWIPLPEKRKC